MKHFLKECRKPNKMRAEELATMIYENQDSIVDFYLKNSHRKEATEMISHLFDKMACEKFAKAIGKIYKKSSKDEEIEINLGLAMVIAGFIEKRHAEMSEDLNTAYTSLIRKILKKRIKEVNKSLSLDESIVADLLLIIPDKSFIRNEKVLGIYCQKLFRKLYILAQNNDIGIADTKTLGKVFKKIIGKKNIDVVATYILLEKKEYLKNFNDKQQALWNLMTQFALDTIEAQEKKHIVELLELYVSRRKFDANKDRDVARRIDLTSIDAEQYPKIAKAVSKLSKSKSNIEKYL